MKAAIYARVSTEDQTDLNQTLILEQWAKDRGWEICEIYRETGSAWQHADQKELRRLIEDCRRGKFQTVLIYDLSRLSRGGPFASLSIIRQLAQAGGEIKSYRENWLEQFTNPIFREAIIGLLGYVNESESSDKSARTKAGMARAKAQGKHVGRPSGSKDTKKRIRRG
jgi:putative DNA-invertase from lambdoid prophage Rac